MITPITFFSLNKTSLSFKAQKINNPATDTLEYNKNLSSTTRDAVLTGADNSILDVIIKKSDISPQKLENYGSNTVAYTMSDNKNIVAYMILSDNNCKDSLTIQELYVDKKYSSKYRGAGTELLKTAVLESINRGYNGRLFTFAANNPPPYVFYYKNNFRPYLKSDSKITSILDFAANNPKIPIQLLLPNITSLPMFLDEKAAKMLLSGIQQYQQNKNRLC